MCYDSGRWPAKLGSKQSKETTFKLEVEPHREREKGYATTTSIFGFVVRNLTQAGHPLRLAAAASYNLNKLQYLDSELLTWSHLVPTIVTFLLLQKSIAGITVTAPMTALKWGGTSDTF